MLRFLSRGSTLHDTRRWLGAGGRKWHVAPMPHAEEEMRLAGTPPFYEVTSEHNQRATARARSKLACCASSRETESAGAPALSGTRRWLGAGGRSRYVSLPPHAEREMPLAGTAAFYEVIYEHNHSATARARSKLACCAFFPETESTGARVLSDTRCWRGVEDLSWHIAQRARAEGARPLADVASF